MGQQWNRSVYPDRGKSPAGFFLAILAIVASWEFLWPRRKQLFSRAERWLSNIGIVIFNTLILRIIFPTAAAGIAEYASANQPGMLNRYNLGVTLEIIIAILILDAAIYFQHVVFHAVPITGWVMPAVKQPAAARIRCKIY